MSVPVLTAEDRARAAEKAIKMRQDRAKVRAKLQARELTFTEVLAMREENEAVGGMRVSAMLEALPGIGKVRAQGIMEKIGIATSRRLRGLGPHQIAGLNRELAHLS